MQRLSSITIWQCVSRVISESPRRFAEKHAVKAVEHCKVKGKRWELLFLGKRLSDALFLDRLKSGSFEIQSRNKATIDAHGMSL